MESTEERRRILRDAGKCFVCLRRGHLARQCQSKTRCPHCHGRHHGSICQKGSPVSQPREGQPKPVQQQPVPPTNSNPTGMNPTASVFKPPTSTALCTSSNQAILLQTAQTTVCNPNEPQLAKHVRLILDGGSQRSYITEELKKALHLRPTGEQSMRIMTFGSVEESS